MEAIFATVLGVLVITGRINLPLVLILAFCHGAIGSVDLPARFSFIIEMVGKRDLASAISLNVGQFNLARFIGPTVAGLVIAGYGVGWAFILNGLSFIFGILAVWLIRPFYVPKTLQKSHPIESLKEGLKFTFSHPQILNFTVLATLTAVFIWPYQTMMPLVAEKVYMSGAKGLGLLLSAAGAGSFTGAIFTSAKSHDKNKIPLIFLGIILASVGLLLFALNRNFILAHFFLFVAGFGMIILASTLNTLVQLATPDNMRARVMGVYLTMFVGMIPLGNALAGAIAQRTSSLFAIGIGAVIVLLVGIVLYFRGISA